MTVSPRALSKVTATPTRPAVDVGERWLHGEVALLQAHVSAGKPKSVASPKRIISLRELSNTIECEFRPLGATGVERCVQVDVAPLQTHVSIWLVVGLAPPKSTTSARDGSNASACPLRTEGAVAGVRRVHVEVAPFQTHVSLRLGSNRDFVLVTVGCERARPPVDNSGAKSPPLSQTAAPSSAPNVSGAQNPAKRSTKSVAPLSATAGFDSWRWHLHHEHSSRRAASSYGASGFTSISSSREVAASSRLRMGWKSSLSLETSLSSPGSASRSKSLYIAPPK